MDHEQEYERSGATPPPMSEKYPQEKGESDLDYRTRRSKLATEDAEEAKAISISREQLLKGERPPTENEKERERLNELKRSANREAHTKQSELSKWFNGLSESEQKDNRDKLTKDQQKIIDERENVVSEVKSKLNQLLEGGKRRRTRHRKGRRSKKGVARKARKKTRRRRRRRGKKSKKH